MTILKAIEKIGGLQSFSFIILGFISSYFLPKLFLNKISKYFYQLKENEKNDGNLSDFYQIKDLKEVKNYL